LDDKLRRVENSDEGLAPLPQALRDRGPAVALAYTYLGDAVWEVYSRQHMILRKATEHAKAGTKNVALRPMEATKRGWCSSVAMHGHLMRLVDGDVLSSEELAILKWGRDFGHESRSGHKSEAHREASALEALVAFWYLFDSERLHFVLETLGMTVCGRPLRELSATAVADAASGAMDALKSDTGGLENDDRETDENEDTVESLRARVAALEEELLLSKRAARLMRARSSRDDSISRDGVYGVSFKR
jgi:23S rRNA maturation mini-RNase III